MFEIIYSRKVKPEITCRIEKANNKLAKYFESYEKFPDKKITVTILNNREELDRIIGRKTDDWLVAFAHTDNVIYILDPKVFELQSSHKAEEFSCILIHEIVHCYINSINTRTLTWLDEGLALNFAGQEKPSDATKENLKYFINHIMYKDVSNQEFSKHQGYIISYWAVNNLLKKFSKETILSLLRIIPRNHDSTKNHIREILASPEIQKYLFR